MTTALPRRPAVPLAVGFVSVVSVITAAAATALEPPPPAGDPLPAGAVARFGELKFRVPGEIYGSAQSPDGKLLAFAGWGHLRVYEAATWRLVHQLPLDTGGSWPSGHILAFSPDGRYLGYTQNGKRATVWDARTGKLLREFDGGSEWRWTPFCAFTPDGLFALSDRDKLSFHEPATGREVRSVPVGLVVQLSPDGRVYSRMLNLQTFAAGENADLEIGDARTGVVLHKFGKVTRCGNGNEGLTFAPDGKTVAVAALDGRQVELWDVATWKRTAALPAPRDVAERMPFGLTVGFTRDGGTVYLCGDRAGIARWDAKTHKELPPLSAGEDPDPGALHLSPDGKMLLTPCYNGWVRVWDAATGKEQPVPHRYRREIRLVVSPDGRTVALADDTGRIDLWDAATGAFLRTVREKGDAVRRLVFSPDGALLAIGEQLDSYTQEGAQKKHLEKARPVRLLRISDGRTVRTFGDPAGEGAWNANPVGFTPDGRRLLTDHYSRQMHLWDMATGTQARGFGPSSFWAALAPDGKTVATNRLGNAVLIDPEAGRAVKEFEVYPRGNQIQTVHHLFGYAWSADGRTLVCTVPGVEVLVLDPQAGRVRRRFRGLVGQISKLYEQQGAIGGLLLERPAVSPDGRWVLTALRQEQGAGVWETDTGTLVALLDHGFAVREVLFAPDGRSAFTCGTGGVGYRWDLAALLAPDPAATAAGLWQDTLSAEGGKGYRAAWGLVGTTDDRRRFLRDALPPAKGNIDPARVKKLVAETGDPQFDVREAATKALAELGRPAAPTLRDAIREAADPEVRQRLEGLLADLDRGLTREELRARRLVRAAELAGIPAARELLRRWAGGAPGAVLTDDARAALDRLDRAPKR